MNWISEKIKAVRDIENVQYKLTDFVGVSCLDDQFYNGSIALITNILSKLCPKWKNINVRAQNIYKLFLSFLLRMEISIPKDDF